MFQLARELGKTVAQLERELSARELMEWVALYRLEARETTSRAQAHGAAQNVRAMRAQKFNGKMTD
jgi:hypothetical protein